MQKHHEETLPALPEDRIRRLNQLNYYFTILPKKTVGTIFTVCVAGAAYAMRKSRIVFCTDLHASEASE